MQTIKPAFSPVNICCACNVNYAKPLSVCLYSLLRNADKKRLYDIIILHSNISSESMEPFRKMEKHFGNCSIRFIDMMEFREKVKDATYAYITAETNYRLSILGDLFREYEKMIYLDCDTIVEGDISELFDTNLKGNAVGGATAVDFPVLYMEKKGFFVDGMPYNLGDYAEKFMNIREFDRYFNAGVLLFDLKKAREFTSECEAIELLNSRKWLYNDQDVLNMLFMDRIYKLDIKWNYTTNIEYGAAHGNPRVAEITKKYYRTEYGVIHYTSGRKPWTTDDIPLGEHWHRYEKELTEVILWQKAGRKE